MVLTFTVILLGLLLLIPPLKKNSFYMVHAGLVILAAYYVENRWFTVTPFHPKTLLLFLVFQLASINLVTFVAYGVDKRAAQKGDWCRKATCIRLSFSAAGRAPFWGRSSFTISRRKEATRPFSG